METIYFGHRRINILDNQINESQNESDSLDGFVKMLSTQDGLEAYNKALADSSEVTDNDISNQISIATANANAAHKFRITQALH